MIILTAEEQKKLSEIGQRRPQKWADLSEDEKSIFGKLASDNTIKHLVHFSKLKKCFQCSKEFPDGVMIQDPYSFRPLLEMFKPEFLVHLKTTHGLDPEIFEVLLRADIELDEKEMT